MTENSNFIIFWGIMVSVTFGVSFTVNSITSFRHFFPYYYAHSITPCYRLSVPQPRPKIKLA